LRARWPSVLRSRSTFTTCCTASAARWSTSDWVRSNLTALPLWDGIFLLPHRVVVWVILAESDHLTEGALAILNRRTSLARHFGDKTGRACVPGPCYRCLMKGNISVRSDGQSDVFGEGQLQDIARG
jgi:hypothetical protein